MTHPIKISHYNKAFQNFCRLVEVRKINSYKEYQANVLRFLVYAETKGKSDLNFTTIEIKAYYYHLKHNPSSSGKMLADNTINHHLFALKLFFEMLLTSGQVTAIPVFPKYIRTEIIPREILTVKEVQYLFSICKNKTEKSLLNLAYGCGMRRTEIARLNVTDVDLRKQIIIVKSGKYDKRREIPLSNQVAKELSNYLLKERHLLTNSKEKCISFLVNKIGRRANGNTLALMLNDILKRSKDEQINAKKITLHCFRHSIATHLLDNGAPVQFVQEFLGHATMDTSQLYAIHRKQKVNLP